jgi:hypothetical protein
LLLYKNFFLRRFLLIGFLPVLLAGQTFNHDIAPILYWKNASPAITRADRSDRAVGSCRRAGRPRFHPAAPSTFSDDWQLARPTWFCIC